MEEAIAKEHMASGGGWEICRHSLQATDGKLEIATEKSLCFAKRNCATAHRLNKQANTTAIGAIRLMTVRRSSAILFASIACF
jgi:hypothetical protein